MKTTRIPENKCPFCGYKVSAASDMFRNRTPSPGDFTVCIECQEVSVFSATLTLRKPTRKEVEVIDRDSDILANQMLMRMYKDEKGKT